MTIQERHKEINEILAVFKVLHEKYYPPARALSEEEWDKCTDDFFYTTERWKGTNLQDLAGEISMAFLNDIERTDKAWKKRRGHELQKTK